MAKEILELEVRSNIKGAVTEVDKLGTSVQTAAEKYAELNENVSIQNEYIATQETELIRLKEIQDSIPKGAWHSGQHQLADNIKDVTSEIRSEKDALKKLKKEQKDVAKAIKDSTKARKKNTNAALRGIQHFNIMGVSIARVRKMIRGVIPSFKLLFGTIKSGIAATGIGVLILALIAIGTSMKKSIAGGKAFKAMMSGIGAVVGALTDAITFVGDSILSIFGFDSEPPIVKSIGRVEKAYQKLAKAMDEIKEREAGQQKQQFDLQRQIDDTTLSEEERLEASKEKYKIDHENLTTTIALHAGVLEATKKELAVAEKFLASAKKRDFMVKQHQKIWDEANKKRSTAKTALSNLESDLHKLTVNHGDEKLAILSTDVKKNKEASDSRQEIRDKAAADEITLLKQLEKIKNELAYRELKTVEEVEKAKLETQNKANIKEIENSTASKTTKDLLLLELDEKYQSDLGIITKKFQDEKDLETEKSEEILKSLKATNIEDETEQALELLQIQKDKEDKSLKSLENYLELKIELDKKYKGLEADINDAAIEKQKAEEKKLADFKKSLRDEGLALIGKALDIQAATIEKNYNEEIELAEANGQSTEGIEKKYNDKRAKNAEKIKTLKIGLAIMDTYQAATAAYANALLIPGAGLALAPIAAALAVASGLANIAMITQTDVGGGGGGGGGGGLPASSAEPPAPEMMSGAFTLEGGKPAEPLQAYVVSDDITNNQNKLAIIRRRATI